VKSCSIKKEKRRKEPSPSFFPLKGLLKQWSERTAAGIFLEGELLGLGLETSARWADLTLKEEDYSITWWDGNATSDDLTGWVRKGCLQE